MDGSPIYRVLELPELLDLILSFLQNDTFALASAIRINKFWNEHGVNILWQEPPSRVLLHVSRERRQFYADHIQALALDAGDDCNVYPPYAELRFPKLRYISIDTYRPVDTRPWIRPYLQPNLEEFEFYGGNVHEDLKGLLAERCPKLKKLLLDNIGTDIPKDDFVSFLERFRKLEDVIVHFNTEPNNQVPEDVFSYLAGRESIEYASFRNLITPSAIRRAHQSVEQPFRDLWRMDMYTKPELLSAIVAMVKHVKNFQFSVVFNEDNIPEDLEVISRLSPMQDLEILHIYYHGPNHLDVNEFLALKKLTKLRELTLTGQSSMALPLVENHDPKNLRDVLKHIPSLQKIDIDLEVEQGIALLAALGQSCPHLEECVLGGIFEIEELRRFPAPLFPSLKVLQLDRLAIRGQQPEVCMRVAHQIYRHAPKLTEFAELYHETHTDQIISYWKELAQRS